MGGSSEAKVGINLSVSQISAGIGTAPGAINPLLPDLYAPVGPLFSEVNQPLPQETAALSINAVVERVMGQARSVFDRIDRLKDESLAKMANDLPFEVEDITFSDAEDGEVAVLFWQGGKPYKWYNAGRNTNLRDIAVELSSNLGVEVTVGQLMEANTWLKNPADFTGGHLLIPAGEEVVESPVAPEATPVPQMTVTPGETLSKEFVLDTIQGAQIGIGGGNEGVFQGYDVDYRGVLSNTLDQLSFQQVFSQSNTVNLIVGENKSQHVTEFSKGGIDKSFLIGEAPLDSNWDSAMMAWVISKNPNTGEKTVLIPWHDLPLNQEGVDSRAIVNSKPRLVTTEDGVAHIVWVDADGKVVWLDKRSPVLTLAAGSSAGLSIEEDGTVLWKAVDQNGNQKQRRLSKILPPTPTPEPSPVPPTSTPVPPKPTPKPTETSGSEGNFSTDFIQHTESFPDRQDLRNRGERRKKGHLAVTNGLGFLGKVECANSSDDIRTRYDVREGRILDIEGVLYKHTGAPKGKVARLVFKVDFGSFGIKTVFFYLENPTERDPLLNLDMPGNPAYKQDTHAGVDPDIFKVGDIIGITSEEILTEFEGGNGRLIANRMIIYGGD